MSSNLVCKHTVHMVKQIGLLLHQILLITHMIPSYPNWTPLGPITCITITYQFNFIDLWFTYHRTQANSGKCHSECCHGNWSKIKNLGIHVYWRQCLGTLKEKTQIRQKIWHLRQY